VKAALERWLLARWYEGRAPGLLLRGMATIHGALGALRASLYTRGILSTHSLPVPVIVVGNFTAGGTGKTPLVMALVQHLVEKGWKPGVVSRGHGRAGNSPLRVQIDTPASACGDEPLLIARRSGVPVQVDADRVRAAKMLVAEGCSLIIADDGLQHLRLARDIEIEVRDGGRGLGNGLLLPAGPLRERPRSVDFRVVNGGSAPTSGELMQLSVGDARSLAGDVRRGLASFSGQPAHAVAGIGNPARFFDVLRQAGIEVIEHAFPDHHGFCREDFAAFEGPVLMTEKDAVKCAGFGLANAWFVPVTASLPADFYARLDARLAALPGHAPP